jgi:hypothetical protein
MTWYRRHRTDVLLVVVVLLVAAPVVQFMGAQQASRWALTAAVWDDHTISIDRFSELLDVDAAASGGRLYSDKAPGQPFLAVPAYALYRAVGGEPAAAERKTGHLGLWWVSLWSAAVPAAALAVLMRRLAAEVAPRWAPAAALSLALGTLLLPFATVLFSHVLAALLGLVAFLLLRPRDASPPRLALAGLTVGVGVLVEYTVALVAVVLFAVTVVRHRRGAVAFAAGGLVAAALLAAYLDAAFGGPFQVSYRHSVTFGEYHREGLVGVRLPDLAMLVRVLLGERGLFVLTPIVLAGAVGAVALVRRQGRTPARLAGGVGLALLAAFVLLQAGWLNPTGGASPGPRYVVPALPFLAPGVALAFARRPRVTIAAALVGVATMTLATFTAPLVARDAVAFPVWLARLADGNSVDTLLTLRFGASAVLVPLAAAAALAWRLLAVPVTAPSRAQDLHDAVHT